MGRRFVLWKIHSVSFDLYVKLVTFIKKHLSWLILGTLLCDNSVLAPVPKKRRLNTCPSLGLQETE